LVSKISPKRFYDYILRMYKRFTIGATNQRVAELQSIKLFGKP
jgi:hypothetical protein